MENSDLRELIELLRTVVSNQERQMSEDSKLIKKKLDEIHDWKIKVETEQSTRNGIGQWVMKYWPGILALALGAFELKKMTP